MQSSFDPSVPPDHRELGNTLDLFHFQDEAPGMVFWHSRGHVLYRLLRAAALKRCLEDGYQEVMTPQVMRDSIWVQSGHWEHFRENMFAFEDGKEPVALKPVSCPGHLEIVRRRSLSYRDLPMRIAEFGLVHRLEPSGALHGLFRLRQFTQDDGHIFCLPEQLDAEVERFARGLALFYRSFGFDADAIDVKLSTRPPQRSGDDAMWDRAEQLLGSAATQAGLEWSELPEGGAFYGPKLEFGLRDSWNRLWQCGTIQLDLVLPQRFGVSYADAAGKHVAPLMLHRALFGSLERFLGVLLEHTAGALPAWLSPEQVRVLPINAAHEAHALLFSERLNEAALRASVDARDTLSSRIHHAHADRVPFIAIIGDRELKKGTVSLRSRGGGNEEISKDAAIEKLQEECEEL